MKVVNRFEANLLRILHYLLRRASLEQARRCLETPLPAPMCLSRVAVELVQDTLAKGTMLLLAREGGWRRERFLRGPTVIEGRLWERTTPGDLALTFSGATLEFLIWITSVTPEKAREVVWNPNLKTLTLGDQLLLYFAFIALHEDNWHRRLDLVHRPVFCRHALCRLAFPEDFGRATAQRVDFLPWVESSAGWVLEAIQWELANRWLESERRKEHLVDPVEMRAVGNAQEAILGAYLDVIESTQRFDLARFILQTASGLLGFTSEPSARFWTSALHFPAGVRLAERGETYRSALAFLRALDRLAGWTERARSVGYFDEGYAAAQLWLSDWERWDGDQLYRRGQAVVRQIDLLRPR
jgi:hypothetical protein